MAIQEIALFQALSQILQGGSAFCAGAEPLVQSTTAKLAYRIGKQVCNNLNAMLVAGLVAANAEFKTMQSAEKTWVVDANNLPPIT